MTVIILSYTKDMKYFEMLKRCVDSIEDSKVNPRIIVVETNKNLEGKEIPIEAEFIFPPGEFNYNRFLNAGFEHIRDSKKVIISNNDVVYEPGCIDSLYSWLDIYDSVSPTEELGLNVEGIKVGEHVKGWCIGLNIDVYNRMGEWDEDFSFWYQDNDYCNFLEKEGYAHCVIGNAVAHHEISASHNLVENLYESTHGLEKVLYEKWK
tara:strand:- start:88 stop:708 length:621 start_codon:yes stop_codon:yes gene_type:complete